MSDTGFNEIEILCPKCSTSKDDGVRFKLIPYTKHSDVIFGNHMVYFGWQCQRCHCVVPIDDILVPGTEAIRFEHYIIDKYNSKFE